MPEDLAGTRVFLTGFMGSGKSTLGPPLAAALHLGFADLDDLVAERAGESIAGIFNRYGEVHFRTLEAAALRETAAGFVYALGGGTLAREPSLQWALSHGIVVYLKVSVQALQRRLMSDSVIRPLLRGPYGRRLSTSVLREKVTDLLRSRTPLYERAHITLDATVPVHTLVQTATEAIGTYTECNLNDRR